MIRPPAFCILLAVAAGGKMTGQTPPFDQRVRFVIDAYAHPARSGELSYPGIAAKLWMREDAALCSRRLEQLLAAGPSGDNFWMFPLTAVAYLERRQLSESGRHAPRT